MIGLLPITSLYAALLGLLFVGLSVRVIRLRQREGTALGDAGNEALRRAIRVHGNFAEYVPLALVLLAMAELTRASSTLIHVLGALLLAGRLLHAYGVSRATENLTFRIIGMSMTFAVLLGAAVLLLAVRVL